MSEFQLLDEAYPVLEMECGDLLQADVERLRGIIRDSARWHRRSSIFSRRVCQSKILAVREAVESGESGEASCYMYNGMSFDMVNMCCEEDTIEWWLGGDDAHGVPTLSPPSPHVVNHPEKRVPESRLCSQERKAQLGVYSRSPVSIPDSSFLKNILTSNSLTYPHIHSLAYTYSSTTR